MGARVAPKWQPRDHELVAGPPADLKSHNTSFRCDGGLLRPPAAGPPSFLKRQGTNVSIVPRWLGRPGCPENYSCEIIMARSVCGRTICLAHEVQFRTFVRPFQRQLVTSSISDDLKAPCSPSITPEVDPSLPQPESRTGTTVHQAAQRKASEEAKKKAAGESQRQATKMKEEEDEARRAVYIIDHRDRLTERIAGSVVGGDPTPCNASKHRSGDVFGGVAPLYFVYLFLQNSYVLKYVTTDHTNKLCT